VNFTDAWRSSGLTSFPALDLSKGNNFNSAFNGCSALTTIEDGILLGTSSSSVDFTSAFKACTVLTTLPSNLDLSKGDDFQTAFQNCQSLVNFPANAFDTMGTPQSYCFLNTWLDNNALSAASVENILVSINTSGQSAPSTGPEITIKYNTATGSLSAATNAAIDSLSGKGWEVFINGVLVIPNILDLQPAAAYSLRSFDADADPNVVRVRRSSDGALSNFKASEVTDGTLTTWVGAGNDGHVTTWYDQAGSNDADQPLVSSMPKLVDGGTLVTEGGLAALDFDGADDSLKYSGDLFGTNTAAMFIVNSFDVATATKRDIIAGGQDTSGSRYDFVIVRQSNGAIYPYIEGAGFSGGVSITDTNAHLYSLTHNAGTSTGAFGRDGVTTSTPSSSASVTSATDFVIGRDISSLSYFLNGQIQEIVVFNTDQSANRTGIENNINDTYTIY